MSTDREILEAEGWTVYLKMTDLQKWDDLSTLAQELARKKYPKQLRHRSRG